MPETLYASCAFFREFSSNVEPSSIGLNPTAGKMNSISESFAIKFTSSSLCGFPVANTIFIELLYYIP